MLKCFVILLTVLSWGFADIDTDPFHALYLVSRCDNYTDPEADLIKVYGCAVEYNKLETSEDFYRYYCNDTTSGFCAHITTYYYISCMTKEEQYLIDFLVSSYKEAKDDFFCKKPKDYAISVINEVRNCLVKKNKLEFSVGKCVQSAFEDEDPTTLILTKPWVYSKVPGLQRCIAKKIQTECKSDLFTEFYNDISTPFLNWCKKQMKSQL